MADFNNCTGSGAMNRAPLSVANNLGFVPLAHQRGERGSFEGGQASMIKKDLYNYSNR